VVAALGSLLNSASPIDERPLSLFQGSVMHNLPVGFNMYCVLYGTISMSKMQNDATNLNDSV
ncbi:hypothetical protein PC128_g24106, partial [Phytophthora cactorum]